MATDPEMHGTSSNQADQDLLARSNLSLSPSHRRFLKHASSPDSPQYPPSLSQGKGDTDHRPPTVGSFDLGPPAVVEEDVQVDEMRPPSASLRSRPRDIGYGSLAKQFVELYQFNDPAEGK
eukprot:TRINITY_DN3010_c0_g2_i1.p2 TRINITY_DN3010_c0_g2~~TRINITY_DN3010_c0_g2_i1.p2  ORF type:complete len:121 (-),score=27.97 TRINITY_DN3010_c0_g2_i1:256-618(-)